MNNKPHSVRGYRKLGAIAAVMSMVLQCSAQGTITFDGPPWVLPGSNIFFDYYNEQGMEFRPIKQGDMFNRAGGGVSIYPENGTVYILSGFTTSLSGIWLFRPRFGLISVDLAEFSTYYAFPATVRFVGYKPDGTTVTTSFTTDGVIDGTGPATDFETFFFDQRFADLVRFEVPGYGYSLDNLVFTDRVPEPAVMPLAVLGVMIFGLRFLRRRGG